MNNLLLNLLLVATCFFLGCYEPTEGCLQFWATDYSVLADEPCEMDLCCTEPRVALSLTYSRPDSSRYTFGDTIYHSASDTYLSLLASNLFISDFEVLNNGIPIELTKSAIDINGMLVASDFNFDDKHISSTTISNYREPYEYNSIAFTLGIPTALRDTSIFGQDNTIVAVAIDSLYEEVDDNFPIFGAWLGLDTIPGAIDTIHCVSNEILTKRISIEVDQGDMFNFGANTTLDCKLMVTEWINAVDITNADFRSLADSLLQNIEPNLIVDID